jgi:DHA1 family multidrug resistance protein-like MFS transporter
VGAAEVAALAIVAAVSPLSERGRAFGTIYAAQLAGMAIGPLVGSLIGVEHMHLLFVVAAAGALLACLPTAWATRAITGRLGVTGGADTPDGAGAESGVVERGVAEGEVVAGGLLEGGALLEGGVIAAGGVDGDGVEGPRTRHHEPFPWGRPIVGALAAAAAVGLLIGVYESCWTLLLESRGAASWQIGLSWTLFAVPFVAMSVPAGRLADRFDRRWLVVAGLASSACFAVSYPFIHDIGWLVGLGAVEAVGVALIYPSLQSLLTEFSPSEHHGQAQGIFATGETAATALAAGLGGWLFGMASWLPFVAMAIPAMLFTAAVPVIWATVPGRVTDPAHGAVSVG